MAQQPTASAEGHDPFVVVEVSSLKTSLFLRGAAFDQIRVSDSMISDRKNQNPPTLRVCGLGTVEYGKAKIVIGKSRITVNGRLLARKYTTFIIKSDGTVIENAFIRTFE
jgi:hypothetical protein